MSLMSKSIYKQAKLKEENSVNNLLLFNQHKIRLGLHRVNKAIKNLSLNTEYPSTNICTINGTSGKNSIIQILKNILIVHKKKYAAFYSPHLVSVTERFEHNKKFIKLAFLKKILLIVHKQKNLTQFEKLTIAFGLFIKNLNLDWVYGEFGLFGRKDSVRALFPKPNLHIISPISFDHLNWTKTKKMNLKTLKEIVYEKTSFLRSKLYISKQTRLVLSLIKSNLKKNKNPKIIYGKDFKLIKKNKKYFYKDKIHKFEIKSNLLGDHMYENATVAIRIALDFKIPLKTIKAGLKRIEIPGRMQLIKKGKLRKGFSRKTVLICDGAHNLNQSEQINKAISGKFKVKNKYCVISMINTKDPRSFLKPFKNKFKKVYFVNMEREKNVFPKEKLKSIADSLNIKSATANNLDDIKKDLKQSPCDLFLITGSLYFIGSILNMN